ncbi:MAG: ferritin-like domain-containing protein [Myxococcales bacterium]
MSKKPTDLGANRTGAALSPIQTGKMVKGAEQAVPEASFDVEPIARLRTELSSTVDPVGTMPPPATVKGAAKTVVEGLKGNDAMVFIDLIGERLAFERSGTRLYEALLSKFDAASIHEEGFSREDLERIRDDELRHFGMLVQTMEQLGADPTAMTPSANVMAVASMGLFQVVTDPRTTFTEALKAILTAELVDNDCWLQLSDLAARLGKDDLAEKFRAALQQEEEHLARIRSWLATRIDGQLGLEDAGASAPPPVS